MKKSKCVLDNLLSLFFSRASPNGDARTRSDTLAGAVKRQCAELQAFLYLPSNAVPFRRWPWTIQFGSPGLAATPAPSGGHDEPTIPWHAPLRQAARTPPRFAEGNRDIPQSQRG